ncbi:MAG: MBL fold metallo-hydrolase [Bacteroidales bacterium]|nr:MBL fold metallo-hydrolase [Bacteroidales bacterium]
MVQFISLSSGSNGNCYYIGDGVRGILIDVGIGARSVKKRLLQNGIDVNSIVMVLVSHDHFDHIRSLGTFTERFKKPVYATDEVLCALEHHYCTAGYMKGCTHALRPDVENDIDGILVTPFRVPHDAEDTVGYHILFNGERFTFMTDIGAPTDAAVHYASLAAHLIVEANYDVDMLMRGSYPPELKRRIMAGHGHLSNEQMALLLKRCWHKGLKDIYLCHLSENNNTPSLALAAAREALRELGVSESEVNLKHLPRREASELFSFLPPID